MMQYPKHRYILTLGIWCALFFGFTAGAQDSSAVNALEKAHANSRETAQWKKVWQGYFDLYHPVEMILTYDGKGLTGHYTFTDPEGPSFILEGIAGQEEWILHEIDDQGRITGNLVLMPHGENLEGTWWATDFSSSAPLKLRPRGIVMIREFVPECIVLGGQTREGDDCKIYLVKEAPQQCSGYVYTGRQKEIIRMHGTCADPLCKRWKLDQASGNGWSGDLLIQDDAKAIFKMQTAENNSTAELVEEYRYPLEIHRKVSYAAILDAVTPGKVEEKFDDWLHGKVASWEKSVWGAKRSASTDSTITSRYASRYSLWTEIGLLNDWVISGLLTFSTEGKGQYARTPFTYDLDAGKWIKEEDLYRKYNALKTIIERAVADVKAKAISGSADEGYSKWIREQDFSYSYFRMDGLVLVTDFDPVFGELEAVVPGDVLVPFIKHKFLKKTLAN